MYDLDPPDDDLGPLSTDERSVEPPARPASPPTDEEERVALSI